MKSQASQEVVMTGIKIFSYILMDFSTPSLAEDKVNFDIAVQQHKGE